MNKKPTYQELENWVKTLERSLAAMASFKSAYESRNRSYQLLINLSSMCINVPVDKVKTVISKALSEIGKFVFADRAYIFKYDFSP